MTDTDHRVNYSVLDLYVVGLRMVDDYDEDAAVAYYMDLHPEANAVEVRAELESELLRLDKEW